MPGKVLLDEAKTASDGENLAGDKTWTCGEEEHGLGDIVGGAVALKRRTGSDTAGFFRLVLA